MLLNAYYFRQHMYTLVPRYVREDMRWLADVGTNAISVGILEQDLYASVRNIETIINEAVKAGLEVHAVPSRWGALMAGSLKVPSFFTTTHPETWILNEDGKPHYDLVGPMSSLFHPETEQFMRTSLQTLLEQFPFEGIVWDELKTLWVPDYSSAAIEALGMNYDQADLLQAHVDFFGRLNQWVEQIKPGTRRSMFVYAHLPDEIVSALGTMVGLDDLGCDGRPWHVDDGGTLEEVRKTLLGPGERFITAARQNGKRPLMLIENHNLRAEDEALMESRLPEVLDLDVEHWIYYYYGRNCDNPDEVMRIMAQHLSKIASVSA